MNPQPIGATATLRWIDTPELLMCSYLSFLDDEDDLPHPHSEIELQALMVEGAGNFVVLNYQLEFGEIS